MDEICEARIRPFPNDTEVRCDWKLAVPHTQHEGVLKDYAYPGSKTALSWMDGDRRTFRGKWVPCPADCTLPIHHRGEHAP